TDSVMVYRNHVARQTPRDVYARHYIGEAARRRRLEEIAARLAELHGQIVSAAPLLEWLDRSIRQLDRARTEARRLPDLVARAEGLHGLKLQAQRLAEQKEKIDRSEIHGLEHSRDEIATRRMTLNEKRDTAIGAIGEATKQIERSEQDLAEAID